jgi:hypothetical protein
MPEASLPQGNVALAETKTETTGVRDEVHKETTGLAKKESEVAGCPRHAHPERLRSRGPRPRSPVPSISSVPGSGVGIGETSVTVIG